MPAKDTLHPAPAEFRAPDNGELRRIAGEEGLNYPLEDYEPNQFWQEFMAFLQELISGLFGEVDINGNTLFTIITIISFLVIAWAAWQLFFRPVYSPLRTESAGSSSRASGIRETEIRQRNLEEEMAQAREARQWRLLLRLLYLHSLKLLDSKGFISFKLNKTNAEYLYEIQNRKVTAPFQRLSLLFDYGWYGHYEVDERFVRNAEELYETLKKQIAK